MNERLIIAYFCISAGKKSIKTYRANYAPVHQTALCVIYVAQQP